MSDEDKLDSKVDSGKLITGADIKKSAQSGSGVRSANEGYIYKFSEQISKNDQDKTSDD